MRLVPSRYNTVAASAGGGGHLVFNAFTGALLELDGADYAAASGVVSGGGGGGHGADAVIDAAQLPDLLRERLLRAGVLVPHDFDERAALFELRRQARAAPDTLLLTIAPTIQCNFRCTYCFETHRQEVMSPATEGELTRFIVAQSAAVRSISTTWFGGEPLLQPDIIDRVQRFTNAWGGSRGIRIRRGIVTNGYFLDPPMVARLQALGEWEMVQVTIDGLPEMHDRRRVLHGGQGTWDRIIANCRAALAAGLPINLRINVDRRNAASIGDLLDVLIAGGVVPDAQVSLGFIVDSTGACAHVADEVLSDEERARLVVRFDAELLRRGVAPTATFPAPTCGPLCSVESPLGYVVAPSGLLFKCWNQVDRDASQAIGHVAGRAVPNADEERARWARYDPASRRGCSNCSALPTCMGGCPWEYERLGRVERGECDPFRFFPQELVTLAHAGRRMRAGGTDARRAARLVR
jgi:uncharacterized protein